MLGAVAEGIRTYDRRGVGGSKNKGGGGVGGGGGTGGILAGGNWNGGIPMLRRGGTRGEGFKVFMALSTKVHRRAYIWKIDYDMSNFQGGLRSRVVEVRVPFAGWLKEKTSTKRRLRRGQGSATVRE